MTLFVTQTSLDVKRNIKYCTIQIRRTSLIYKSFSATLRIAPSGQLDTQLAFQWIASNDRRSTRLSKPNMIKKAGIKCRNGIRRRNKNNSIMPSCKMVDIYHAIALIKRFGSRPNYIIQIIRFFFIQ